MAFSENLKKIREENGVSQAELAKKSGCQSVPCSKM